MAKMTLIAEPGKHDILMSREFNAPRELVFRALTDPTLVPRWWGPSTLTTVVDKMDVKAGGIWRFVQRDAAGNEYGFHGVYHEVLAPERIIQTFEFEGLPGHVLLETMILEEHDGKTAIIDSSVFQTVEDRDGMLQSGMEGGAAESWDRFEALLKTM
jgi:uncharacterized protein YndB with AHSA1/START domain